MSFSRTLAAVAIAALLAIPCGSASAKGFVSGSYTLGWTQDVQKKTEYKDTRTFKQTLDTKYSGFLSPVIENELTFKIDYDKGSTTEAKVRMYPAITLTYKGSYWGAGSKRSVTQEPDTPQKVTDSYFVELLYKPFRFGTPDLKAKYGADLDTQVGQTDKFKQTVTLSSNYQPAEWFNVKGDYTWSNDDERFRKDVVDPKLTPVTREEKYSFTSGVRHFLSDKLKLGSEWKSEFSRGATFFDNGAAKGESVKEDQAHTSKNTFSFRPFDVTSFDATYDYDLKQTMVPKAVSPLLSLEEHTITTNTAVRVSQKVGRPIELRGEFTRAKTDVRHTLAPGINIDDGWTLETKGDFGPKLQLNGKYARHNILIENPGAPSKRTGNTARSASWNGELLPFWKPSITYDKTDTDDFTVLRSRFLKTSETKYGLKGPLDFKRLDLLIEPSYDIGIKRDYTNLDISAREVIDTRDFKVKVAKTVLVTRTIEFKVDHTYGRKQEKGHKDPVLNNITRSDSSSGNVTIKDVVPDYTGGLDFSRSANDTSGDADGPDVTENFGVKVDYKYSAFGWNATYKYDRNLRADKANKWTFDWKGTWTAKKWDFSLSYNQTKTLSLLLDESYKVGVDFKYNF